MFIGNYFGDPAKEACGICDYCLAHHKKDKLTGKGFTSIEQRLYSILSKTPTPIDRILAALGKEEEGFIWEVLHYLESENKLIMNEDSTIQLI